MTGPNVLDARSSLDIDRLHHGPHVASDPLCLAIPCLDRWFPLFVQVDTEADGRRQIGRHRGFQLPFRNLSRGPSSTHRRLTAPIIMALLSSSNIVFSMCAFVVYVLGLYFYRVFLDPLSKFPGPKLAAASLWYEFYYDVIKKGRYTWEIARMHDKYGTLA